MNSWPPSEQDLLYHRVLSALRLDPKRDERIKLLDIDTSILSQYQKDVLANMMFIQAQNPKEGLLQCQHVFQKDYENIHLDPMLFISSLSVLSTHKENKLLNSLSSFCDLINQKSLSSFLFYGFVVQASESQKIEKVVQTLMDEAKSRKIKMTCPKNIPTKMRRVEEAGFSFDYGYLPLGMLISDKKRAKKWIKMVSQKEMLRFLDERTIGFTETLAEFYNLPCPLPKAKEFPQTVYKEQVISILGTYNLLPFQELLNNKRLKQTLTQKTSKIVKTKEKSLSSQKKKM